MSVVISTIWRWAFLVTICGIGAGVPTTPGEYTRRIHPWDNKPRSPGFTLSLTGKVFRRTNSSKTSERRHVVAAELSNRRVAILATDGAEQVEIEQPRRAVEQAGARVTLVSLNSGRIQAMNGDIDKGDTFPVDTTVSETSPDDYDALIMPGGTINPDRLRSDADAVEFVRRFVTSGKPVGSLCHGPWPLAEADVVRGRTV